MIGTPPTKSAMAEELILDCPSWNTTNWEDDFPLREFLRQFRGVGLLRLYPFVREVGLCLQQEDDRGHLSRTGTSRAINIVFGELLGPREH